ncbi:MAG: helix-turn-helix domain-containing protein [Bacillota bacterium]|nr:helix-turn-helix domain-containing protein [Bacillota bacterium]
MSDERGEQLRRYHALHPRPEAVYDDLFVSSNPFFDPRDVVQVKYEMLRRVHHDEVPIAHAAARFGLSRPTFYEAQSAFLGGGLPALLPQRPGPRRAHKLTDEVMAFVDVAVSDDPSLRGPALAALIWQRFKVKVHPRSIERRLAQRRKRGRSLS